ncbi:MAG: calcium/sodium antiporter [Pseudomonadota bacterium]
MAVDLAQVVAGLVLLLFAGDMLVRGAISAGLKLRVPAIIIGLTIIAFGTSAPELFVTVQASLEGAPGIAVGNVIGSNVANVLLVLGVPAMLAPIGDHSTETKRNYEIMLGVTLVTVGLCLFSPLTWWQGALLLAMLAGFLLYNYRRAMGARAGAAAQFDELEDGDPSMPNWKVGAMILGGLIGLPIGADFIVEGARGVATTFGVSDEAIGLTLVALGTSLPELATTVIAAMRGRADVAIGNVIGSNIFNLLCILGVAASLDDVVIPLDSLLINLGVMIASAIALAPFVWMRLHMDRLVGGAFVTAYAIYIALALATGGAAQAAPNDLAAAPAPALAPIR